MITSSILPVSAATGFPTASARTRPAPSHATMPVSRAGEAPVQRIVLEDDRPRTLQRHHRTRAHYDHAQGTGGGTAPLVGMHQLDTPVVNDAVVTAGDDPDASSARMVDLTLFGLFVIIMAAFFWMIAGHDDLSTPFLVASSWLWHALGTTVIAMMAYGAWQLVRRTSWTVRIVFLGIMILNWILTAWLG